MYLKIVDDIVKAYDLGYVPDKNLHVPIKCSIEGDYYYKINNRPEQKADDKIVIIPKEVLAKDEMLIRIVIKGSNQSIKKAFESDKIKLSPARIIGDSEDECYPATISKTKDDITILYAEIAKLRSILDDHEERIDKLETEGDLI